MLGDLVPVIAAIITNVPVMLNKDAKNLAS